MEGHPLHRRNFLLHLQARPGYDQPVLLKESAREQPTRLHLDQLHNEYAITRQLAELPGVRPALAKEGTESQPVLLLEYIQGQSLVELIRMASLALPEKLRIAVDVSGILSGIHAQQVMHKDISSSNILMADDAKSLGGAPSRDGASREGGRVHIIDLGLATTMRQESPPRLAPDDTLVGTLAYISPEQTGRMNRPVDYRTDLYSLGVTLYELFTGQLPFQSSDPLEMIHSHIARLPTPPAEINSNLPSPVSDIILKLMAKNAEDRYQTAHGLQADLRHCLDLYETAGQVEPFELGREDFSERLQIPARLYGREAKIAQLLTAFERTAGGRAELLLVAGYSGVGKTALVHELQRPVTERRGYFIEGKFDQYHRNIPYSAWGQALGTLVDLWLSESEASIEVWKVTILEAVGQSGQVLIELIPNLERVIGPQPAVPELTGLAAQNRFSYLFRRFINAVTRANQPLVVFLDDLQWIDLASLKLFDTLLSNPDSQHVLVIGAYRDNEVDASHPLMLEVSRLEDTGLPVNQLTVDNLNLEHVNTLLADSLRMPPDQCLSLGRLITAKTDGNAFFTRQLLHTLAENGALSFDSERRHWQWDITRAEKMAISENVVELIVDNIQRLPATSQTVLQVAACLGTRFDLGILHLVLEQSQEEVRLALQACFEEGLAIQVNGYGRFAHDRIQQAAYALVPDHKKPDLHRHIGRQLLAENSIQGQDEYLFDIVGHLNKGARLIETAAERGELAELNSNATEAALKATAYAAALDYAQTAISLLGDDGWQSHYPLMLRLHLLAAEAAYLDVDFDLSEEFIERALISARSGLDKASAYSIRTKSYNSQNKLQMAVNAGFDGFQELGVTLQETIPVELTLDHLRNLPNMTDSYALAIIELLDAATAPAYLIEPDVFSSIVLTALKVTVDHGITPSGCYALTAFTVALGVDDIPAANEFGLLALELAERPENNGYLCRVRAVLHSYVFPWQNHFREMLEELRQDIKLGLESGDHIFTGVSLINTCNFEALICDQLHVAQDRIKQYIDLLEKLGQSFVLSEMQIMIQYVFNLQGQAKDPQQFCGPYFDEAKGLPADTSINTALLMYFKFAFKSILHFHLGDYESAFAQAAQAEPYALRLLSHWPVFFVPVYQSLALLQFPLQQTEHVEKLNQNLEKLRVWARHAPMNFQHKLDMVLAERERVAGNVGLAISHYEQAIAGAKQNKFLQDEALANELYGRFWYDQGNEKIAELYLREAHALYRHWGASAITAHLEAQYPQWLNPDVINVSQSDSEISVSAPQSYFDLHSVLKAAEAITGELNLEKLLQTMMTIVMKNAGAQRAFLIIERNGQWIIEAESHTDTDEIRVLPGVDIANSDQVSTNIVHYVAHTQQTVLLNDATAVGKFKQDPAIQRRQAKSVLSLPLINRGQLSGILYLENNLASHVFTPERVELLTLLSAQMAISLDHARLYDHLESEVAERTQALIFAEEQTRALFASSPVGISLTTTEGKMLVANEALLRMTGYTEAEILQRYVPEFYVDPEQRQEVLELLSQAGVVSNFGVKFKRKDGSQFFANLNVSRLMRYGQAVLLAMIEDVTEQVALNEKLQQENAERLKTAAALQASEQFLEATLDTLTAHIAILDASGVIVGVNDAWRQFALDNHLAWPDGELGQNYLATLDAVSGDDAQSGQQAAAGIRAVMAGEVDYFQLEYPCHSPSEQRWFVMHVTRFEGDDGVRVVTAHEDITHRKQAELALLNSNQSLNQRLEELSTLNLIAQTVSTVTDLPDALDIVVAAVTNVFDAAGASLVLLSGTNSEIEVLASFNRHFPVSSLVGKGETADDPANSMFRGMVFPTEDSSLTQELLVDGQSVVIPDAQVDPRLATARATLQTRGVQSLLLAPLLSHGDVIGIMSVSSDQPGREFTRDEVILAETIAGQIAGAIETTRLFEQARQGAVAEERNRLARELHDSATQSLYSATLLSEAGQELAASGDLESAKHYLSRVSEVIHQALKDMRLLVFQMRPPELDTEGLVGALQRRLDAVEKRAGIEARLISDELPTLPDDVVDGLYGIAQEALNNVLKHAEADAVSVTIRSDGASVNLEVVDDGRGFDIEAAHEGGGMGLTNMQERAAQLSGELTIDTAPGQGTKLKVLVGNPTTSQEPTEKSL